MSQVDLGAGALWPLGCAGAVFGCVGLFFFRRFADRHLLHRSWKRLLARFLELRLFMDDPVLILRSQRDLITENIRILRAIGPPALLFLLPAIPAMLLLHSCFARAPLPLGAAAVVTVQFKDARPARLSSVLLSAPPEIRVDTAPVRILSQGQVSWRISPIAATDAQLTIKDSAGSIGKSITTGSAIHLLSARREGSLAGFLLHSGELPFNNTPVAWIEIDYPHAVILGTSWIVWFFGFSFAGALLGLAATRFRFPLTKLLL